MVEHQAAVRARRITDQHLRQVLAVKDPVLWSRGLCKRNDGREDVVRRDEGAGNAPCRYRALPTHGRRLADPTLPRGELAIKQGCERNASERLHTGVGISMS